MGAGEYCGIDDITARSVKNPFDHRRQIGGADVLSAELGFRQRHQFRCRHIDHPMPIGKLVDQLAGVVTIDGALGGDQCDGAGAAAGGGGFDGGHHADYGLLEYFSQRRQGEGAGGVTAHHQNVSIARGHHGAGHLDNTRAQHLLGFCAVGIEAIVDTKMQRQAGDLTADLPRDADGPHP